MHLIALGKTFLMMFLDLDSEMVSFDVPKAIAHGAKRFFLLF